MCLRDVRFTYPGGSRPALTGFTLDVAPGSFVAVTGPVGSGKSALARALTGVYPIESGEVSFRGACGAVEDVENLAIGYLPQDAQLFSGSVRENVLMTTGDSGTAARAVGIAALEPDVAGFPEGM